MSEVSELVDAIVVLLEALISPDDAPVSPRTPRPDLYALWDRLEAVLHQNNAFDVNEDDAREEAHRFLLASGRSRDWAEIFITTCRGTGASWRAVRELAVEFANTY